MNIDKIIAEEEYTKERSAKELFEWMSLKCKELSEWSWKHSETESLRETKHKELSKGLPDKFAHELTPFAYYAKTYYSNNPAARFKPFCGSEQYDGIIIDSGNKTSVEFTNAIYGNEWAITKSL